MFNAKLSNGTTHIMTWKVWNITNSWLPSAAIYFFARDLGVLNLETVISQKTP